MLKKYLGHYFKIIVCVSLSLLVLLLNLSINIPKAEAATTAVSIQNFHFNPDPITIPVGGSITWTNLDVEIHNAVGDGDTTANSWDSGPLNQGQSFTKTFNSPGTYTYSCTFHPTMTGTIVVGQSSVPGDIDGNGKVDIFDYNSLVGNFGKTGTGIPGDIDQNGKVDIFDYNILVGNFGKTSGSPIPSATPTPSPSPIRTASPTPLPTPTPSGTASWTRAKASYLARRVLLDPTVNDIDALANATTASNAVNVLFASPSQSEQTAFQNGVQQIIANKSTYTSVDQYEYTLYTYKLVHDPDKVRRKLAYLWENIFSVDAPISDKTISYDDAKALHQLLYDNAFGSYTSMVNQVQNNYTMAQYLDLTSSKATNPNENFARELLQLFLMGPYTPLDKTQTTPNYTDADVNSLAYILTGYTADLTAHTMTYVPANHYTGQKQFLGTMYNDPINDISYIVQQRKTQISQFLANKLLHYYVSDNPADQDIIALGQIIQNNNFDILSTLKQLFASDMIYSTTYMQEERHKTPFELVSSYYSSLFKRNNYGVIPSSGLLTGLNFQPFRPGSIFGRDGFNTNILFYSGSIMDIWTANTNLLINNISTANIPLVLSNLVPNYQTITTPTALITALSNPLFLERDLPQSVKDQLISYLSIDKAGNPLTFNMQNTTYINAKMPGLLNLLITQPEFLVQSGTISAVSLPAVLTPGGNTTPKLIVVRLRGGIDAQGVVANISDTAYANNRKQMQLTATNSASLGAGYVLNNAVSNLIPFVSSKEVFFVNATGVPNHSRAHDIASTQMEKGLNSQGIGILAQLQNANNSLSNITFSNTPPEMVKGAPSLQIGSSSLILYQGSGTANSEAASRKKYLTQIYNARQFPQKLALYYAQALQLDQLGTNNIALGGTGSAGYTNSTQLTFLDQMLTQNVGTVFYLYGDGGYDHHINEDQQLNGELTNLYTNLINFYNKEKTKTKIAIIIFSEFGRTDKINGTNGTDHGQGGGIVVISNNLTWPTMVGSLKPSTDSSNWTPVQVDARDVWSTLFRDLYTIAPTTLFGRSTTISSYPAIIP